jgi:hypothetical protein
MIMPGDNAKIEVELIYKIAMSEGLRFAIREGGRTVGAGVVTKVMHVIIYAKHQLGRCLASRCFFCLKKSCSIFLGVSKVVIDRI